MLKTVSSIVNAIGALNYKGTWNANTNSPALASGVGTKGDYYVVGTAGSTTLDGISNWGVGDWAAFNGSVWQRVEGGADLNGVNLTVTGTSSLATVTATSETIQSTSTATAPQLKLQNPVVANASQGEANNLSAGQLLFGATGAYPLTAKIESVYNADASFGRSADLVISGANGAGTLTERLRINVSGNFTASGTANFANHSQIAYAGDVAIFANSTTLTSGIGGTSGGTRSNWVQFDNAQTYPVVDNSLNFGLASFRWKAVYAVNGTIQTSDQNQKQDIAELDEAEKRVAIRIKSLIKKYRFKDSVIEKGDAARIHVGAIAQEVQSAFVAEGLDATRYGVFCSDTWYEVDGKPSPIASEPYTEDTPNAVQQTRLGLRYEELFAFVISVL
jgi:hypothetical protein